MPSRPLPSALSARSIMASHWSIDPSLTFLNHGSYGAVPNVVMKYQSDLRARVERDAVRFYKVDLENLMDEMRVKVGRFVNCPPETIAPMVNATVAIATVFIGLGFWQVYFRPKPKCEDGSYCARPQSSLITQIVLWFAAALVILAATIDWWARLFY